MNDYPIQDATLPVLHSPLGAAETEGFVILPYGEGHFVRSVCRVKARNLPALSGEHLELKNAIYKLNDALKSGGAAELRNGIKAATKWYRYSSSIRVSFNFGGKTTDQLKSAARYERAYLSNVALRNSRLVVWTPDNGTKSCRPALYCPDVVTASFALLLVTYQTKMCANKNCPVPFTPSSERQIYHVPNCGNAARTRKSRANKLARDPNTAN